MWPSNEANADQREGNPCGRGEPVSASAPRIPREVGVEGEGIGWTGGATLDDSLMANLNSVHAFNTIGRNDNEWGATGVINIQSLLGATIGPPQAMLYAVEPVGVEAINPSPSTVVT